MTKLYHNNELVFEREKIGFKGRKFAKEVGDYVSQTCNASTTDKIHIFEIKGETVRQILCAFYNADEKKWETKEVFARIA